MQESNYCSSVFQRVIFTLHRFSQELLLFHFSSSNSSDFTYMSTSSLEYTSNNSPNKHQLNKNISKKTKVVYQNMVLELTKRHPSSSSFCHQNRQSSNNCSFKICRFNSSRFSRRSSIDFTNSLKAVKELVDEGLSVRVFSGKSYKEVWVSNTYGRFLKINNETK